jgi:opine dehydrogenase
MKITIIGAGNAGCAHAFLLSRAGNQVTLVKTSRAMHEDNYQAILQQGGIRVLDHTAGERQEFAPLHDVTRELNSRVLSADVVIVLTQSLFHDAVARALENVDFRSGLLLVIPGNLGSVIFHRRLGDRFQFIAEGESTPYDARIIEPGLVNLLYRNTRNALGFLPASRSAAGLELAGQLFDTYGHLRSNVVESALHNPNLVVHTVGTIMSAARIEYTQGDFWMYREAFTPSIWQLIESLDAEKSAVIAAYGGTPCSYVEACKFRNEPDLSRDALEVFRGYAADGGPKGPSTLHSRYLYEDVPMGLCTLHLLGGQAGVPVPTCDALIQIAGHLVGRDFRQDARTLDQLGWVGLDGTGIRAAIS